MAQPRKRVYTPAEVDEILEKAFKGQHCHLSLPGYNVIYGVVNRISMDPRKPAERIINIQFNDKDTVYTCELQWLHECLKITKKEAVDGNND
jgi:hypothetical protein